MKINKDTKFLIVGLGLIGGSYAMSLSKKGYVVGAIDKDQRTIDYAIKRKIISTGKSEGFDKFISEFDVICLALYPKMTVRWLKENHQFIKDGAIITDVTGVKSSIVYEIQQQLKTSVEFIGAHPMAGKERSGIKNASDEIFKGANFIITPTDKNTKEAIELVKQLAEELGFQNVSLLSPESHDEMIGYLSQLTHCIAVSLMTVKDGEQLARYTGDSFRDLTRIADINETMWTELFLMNKQALLKEMNNFIEEFNSLKESIEKEDVQKIKEMMKLSSKRRRAFNKK